MKRIVMIIVVLDFTFSTTAMAKETATREKADQSKANIKATTADKPTSATKTLTTSKSSTARKVSETSKPQVAPSELK
ncbi:MAG: hypothetical protein ACYDGO_03835 [Smithellaceae bacterium]